MSARLLSQRYRLVEAIGRGGMGTVWLGQDELLQRTVAIKEVRIAEGLPEDERDNLVERTMREARICAQLNHPAIVTVHDVVREDGRPWVVMEMIDGRGLDQVVSEQGPLSPERTAAIGAQAASALRQAHAAGVLHRDIKPSNIMVNTDDQAVLTDFGIATQQGDSNLTQGGVIGTPGYLAPEQLQQGEVGPAADLWALGATLYYLVEGRPAYQRDTPGATAMAPLTGAPDPAQRAGQLWPVVQQLLHTDPAERPNVATVEAQLGSLSSGTEEQAGARTGPPTGPQPPESSAGTGSHHSAAMADPAPGHPPGYGYPTPQPGWAPPTQQHPPRRNTGRLVGMITAGVLVVAILGIVGVLVLTQLTGQDDSEPAPAADPAEEEPAQEEPAEEENGSGTAGLAASADPVPDCADVDAEVLGQHVPDMEHTEDEYESYPEGDTRYCDWESEATTTEADGFASVFMMDNVDGPEAAVDELTWESQDFGGSSLDGVGDAAESWYDEQNQVGCVGSVTAQLYVRVCYDAAQSPTDSTSISESQATDVAQEITEGLL